MELIKCTEDNIPFLAELNKQLYEDEKNDKIPSLEDIKATLRFAIQQNSIAYLFVESNEIVGYALVRLQPSPYYLSHFFICKNMRRKHLGTAAFQLLMSELNTDSIDLDVFYWNERGQAFWRSLGFKERCIIMRKQI
jgi:ribosomal protein S18 acetylase RimI-like enzyme